MKNKMDFYQLGRRYANEAFDEMTKKAEEIGELFGKDAQMEFEAGVVSTINEYEFVKDDNIDDIDINYISGKTDIGIPNVRNNSYFGGVGTSKQFITDPYGNKKFNEPKKRR